MKEQKGITLVALVITIIVMLILVGVSITVALNGGLFTSAKEAANNTVEARNAELNLSNGKVTVNGEEHNVTDWQ
jgi:type II secretory pathway pseudopilin PulG